MAPTPLVDQHVVNIQFSTELAPVPLRYTAPPKYELEQFRKSEFVALREPPPWAKIAPPPCPPVSQRFSKSVSSTTITADDVFLPEVCVRRQVEKDEFETAKIPVDLERPFTISPSYAFVQWVKWELQRATLPVPNECVSGFGCCDGVGVMLKKEQELIETEFPVESDKSGELVSSNWKDSKVDMQHFE
jgi:hypothetical protein